MIFSSMIRTALSVTVLALALPAFAEQTVGEQAKEAGRNVKTSAKKAGRKVKDATCETTNGKMECAAQEAKHGVQNATDSVKDSAKTTKEKID